jgi:methionyl-tRNA formyltransferase
MSKKFKLVFMGTPDFALPTLKRLHETEHTISLVVTQPDRPKGRGRKITAPPVKRVANEMGYAILQPVSIKTDAFAQKLGKLKPDFLIVVSYGHIIPENILAVPRFGAINLHASLLPKFRGAAPIQWAIINREKETGVTTIFIDSGLDTGDILLSDKLEINPDDTSTTLHERLAVMGANLMIKTLNALDLGSVTPRPQRHDIATYAPLLKSEDGHINWKMAADDLDAFIRGVTPWPGAFTFCGKKRLKIFKARPVLLKSDEIPGTVIKGFSDELRVATGKGALSILEIQGASGKRLSIKDFMQGARMGPGTVLF